MLSTPKDVTRPQKVTTSYTDKRPEIMPFGQPAAHVDPIDDLAARDRGYDPELAYLMSVVSTWTYSDERALGAKLRYYGFDTPHVRRITIQNNALLVVTTAYLIQSKSGKSAVLAFRGTDPGNLITILTDTQVMHQPFFDTRVHAGFHASVEAVWDDVHVALTAAQEGFHVGADDSRVKMDHPLESLYITGHSLGGAMAVLAAARLSRDDYKDLLPRDKLKGIYTYGQPMVGDRAFAKYCEERFGSKLFRHVYRDDFVPCVPPKLRLEYAHTGHEWRTPALDEPWKKVEAQSKASSIGLGIVSLAVNAIEARVASSNRIPGLTIDDHMPANYLEASRYTLNPRTKVEAAKPGNIMRRIGKTVLEKVEDFLPGQTALRPTRAAE